MRKIIASMACFAFVICAGGVAAQATGATLSSKDANKTDAHDRPIGGVTIKLPLPGGTVTPPTEPPPPPPAPNPPMPPAEGEDIPPVETPPDPPPPEDPPTYYGEPLQGKFAFILDASGSMSGRIAALRAETTATITDMTDDDEFDCAAYGGQFDASNGYTVFMWGSLLPATDGNKSSAISWVNGSTTNPGGMTPSYACLQKCCAIYPSDLDKFFFITDGWPNITGSASQILADFPSWWSKFEDCEMVAICIGGAGADFMQSLAALAGGTYIAV